MKIFLTGATGFIGSVVAEKLLEKGHTVVGLARSETSAKKLQAKGIEVVFGDLDDLNIFNKAASKVDGVIHAGFKQRDKGFLASIANERNTVGALLEAIKNSGKPIIYTSGTGMLGDTGTIVFDEETSSRTNISNGETAEEMTQATVERMKTESDVLGAGGVRGVILRPPNVYGRSNGHALLPNLIAASNKIDAVPYADFSRNHLWSFVHVDDLADLYVLALERSKGGELYYTGAERGLKTKDIAEALSIGLGYKGKTIEVGMAELINLFDSPFMANFWTWNNQSSNVKAKELLGWKPNHTDMLKAIAKPIE